MPLRAAAPPGLQIDELVRPVGFRHATPITACVREALSPRLSPP